MNSIVGPILIKFLVKKDVCESHEQCTRPTDSAISNQCVDVQSASGSHMKLTSRKKKKKKKTFVSNRQKQVFFQWNYSNAPRLQFIVNKIHNQQKQVFFQWNYSIQCQVGESNRQLPKAQSLQQT